jgi:protein SMG7
LILDLIFFSARYIRDINPKSRDWMASAEYYKRALKLMPTWGNPHNQLAVLNTYCDDEFNAVYHYFRSLAVTHPFLTARDNLNVLLEKNKSKVEGSSPSSQSS